MLLLSFLISLFSSYFHFCLTFLSSLILLLYLFSTFLIPSLFPSFSSLFFPFLFPFHSFPLRSPFLSVLIPYSFCGLSFRPSVYINSSRSDGHAHVHLCFSPMWAGVLSGERVELKKAEDRGNTAVGSRGLRIEQPVPLWSSHTERAVPQITETKAEWYGLGSDKRTENQRDRERARKSGKEREMMRWERVVRIKTGWWSETGKEYSQQNKTKKLKQRKQRCLRHINAALWSGTVPPLLFSDVVQSHSSTIL